MSEDMYADITVDGRVVTARVVAGPTSELKREDLVGVGTATCNPDDHFVEKIGRQVAVGRAFEDYGRQLAERWAARAVTEEEVRQRRGEPAEQMEMELGVSAAVAVRDAILGQPEEEVEVNAAVQVLVSDDLDAFVSMIADRVVEKITGLEP